LRNQAAYVLATAYWETNRTMRPVREAYWLSEDWRKRNLRYFPWYGRGFVQLTWQANYEKAGKKLNVNFMDDPDKVMLPDYSTKILVTGMREGWFTSKKLSDYLTLHRSDYRGARRIVNGTDKASAIAELAREYEEALLNMSYGVEKKAAIVNERRDGSPPREKVVESTTLQATLASGAAGASGAFTAIQSLDGYAQLIVIGAACVAGLGLLWIARERIKKWSEGDR